MNAIAVCRHATQTWVFVVLVLAGCATIKPTEGTDPVALDQAVADAIDSLVVQTQKLPAFIAKFDKRSLVIDPMIDSASGQQTALTRQIEEKVTAHLVSKYPQLPVLPFRLANLNRSEYVLTGTSTRLQGAKTGAQVPFQINLALTEIGSGNVVAQASSMARDDGQDTTPTRYYRDSPEPIKDKVVEGYIDTCRTPPGQPAAKDYFDRLATATTINDATIAYDGERYQEALDFYKAALALASSDQLRTLNGIYLASWKLGRARDAEQAFGRVVALGIAGNSLGVKFLFNPGTTEFWSDVKVSGPYAIWVRQIARQTTQAKVCMNIVGHASHSGSEGYNDKLSEQRAASIRQMLAAESIDLLPRTRASGVGFRENIIGTGTDDASDSLDRRVEFKIAAC
jgi:outer membrane protein OmpA-like peptidoglycan-associated protein